MLFCIDGLLLLGLVPPWCQHLVALGDEDICHTGYLCVAVTEQCLAQELSDVLDQTILVQVIGIQHQAFCRGPMLPCNKR